MKKNMAKRLLAAVLSLSMVLPSTFAVSAAETQKNVNLALDKPVTASAAYTTLPASYLTDADKESRWSTEQDATQWAYVDLGSTQEMNYFSVIWESASVYGECYNIYVSDSTTEWGTPVVERDDNDAATSVDVLEEPVSGRYVKLEVTKVKGYPSVSARDFTIMYSDAKAQNPNKNVALGKATVASSIEADSVRAALAVDGDTESKSSRWGSDVGSAPHWIYVDLGEVLDVQTVKIFWENRKATAYEIQTAEELTAPMAESDWTTQKAYDARPKTVKETISLAEPVKARYVRLLVSDFTAEDPDGGVEWESISIYEMEVYGGIPKVEYVDPSEAISVETPAKGDKKLVVNIPESEGYEVVYNGTDYEQIVDRDLTIYQPLVDTTVKVSFKVTETAKGKYKFVEIPVVIPGQYKAEAGDNAAPVIIPELREWKGSTGVFEAVDSARIVYANDELKDMAEVFASDYAEITGMEIEAVKGTEAKDGDIYFVLTDDTSLGLKDEGYLMEIEDKITVTAEDATGAYWATRTILQSFKANDNTINKGITRDYPLYEIRGFILDVGRKTFTIDYLEQVTNLMSWYKMNDFQVHLNDNLIPLEHYSQIGEDPMKAYSGFRLESDIKEGGNGGLNKADLTSKDVFYTKDEFRSYIKESRVRGVDIVPEIDTPAHSLALTKVRPDLRQGTYGRENDHLNLTNKYDDSYAFVTSIFNEYMGEDLENPVFDEETIVHVGADEYSANGDAYRRFCNDMFKYVQDTGRVARVWGSLTSIKGSGAVDVRGDQHENGRVQMNLWNYGWANIDEMYDLGFDLINCNDGNYYIVPNAGYYYDYLNDGTLYNLAINTIGGFTVPAGDEQMKGGAFAVWNDMTDYLDNGISEYDVYDRIKDAVPLFGAKLWGKHDMSLAEAKNTAEAMGDGPATNFGYEVEADENGVIAEVATDADDAIELKGGKDFVETELTTAGLENDLRVKVKRTSDSTQEQILFESSYGTIKAVQKETGKVGFSRENFDYSFDYTLPVDEWVELEFKNAQNVTSLYVNGVLVDTLGDGERVEGQKMLATMMIPFAKIGSETNAFIGLVDDVRLGVANNYVSAMELQYAVDIANILLAKEDNADLAKHVEEANAVIAKFAPTKEEVEELTGAIYAIIEATEYEKADYSRVNAYADLVAGDMSAFTDESVERVNRVLASIREDLPAENQDIVDGYEAQLSAAIAELSVKVKADVNFVDNKTLTGSVSSYQDNGSAADKALDDDPTTMWHSKWSITTMPHWFQFTFNGEAEAVNGITYVPRQTGVNGNVTKYIVMGSNDGVNFTNIKEGTLPSSTDTKEITFDAVTYKHIRLQYVEAVNNNGSAAEFKLHKASVAVDKDGLKALIDAAKAVENAGYTEESWDALQAAIEEAEAFYAMEAPDAQEVEVMKRTLQAAKVALVLVPQEKEPEPTPTPVPNPFKDVVEGQYYYNPVLWAVENKVTSGLSADTFGVGNACTREQIVTFLWNFAGQPAAAQTTCAFTDVNPNHYYYKAMLWAVENKITSGLSTDTFGVGQACTREQIVTFLWNFAKQPTAAKTDCAFKDVNAGHYYYKAMLWAVENGVVAGYNDTTFGTGDACTREQIVTFLYRYNAL